jgi:pimeloyl-ACP methyl ester carboxylesterase
MTKMETESLWFEVSGRLRLAADAMGPADAEPVLLLHGGGQTRHAWRSTAASLAACGYRAVSVDARGHGDSDWSPAGEYQREHFADDLKRIVESLGRKPAVVGASLGGIAAMLAIGGSGMLVSALVLVDVAPHIEPDGVARIMSFMRSRPDGFASVEEAADAVASYLPHRKRPDDLSGLRKNLRQREDGRLRWHWDPRFLDIGKTGLEEKRARAEDVVRNISAPTLLVRGKLSDLLSEEGAQKFLRLVPHAEYADITGAAHMVAGDKNDRFSAAVIEFLQRAVPTSA